MISLEPFLFLFSHFKINYNNQQHNTAEDIICETPEQTHSGFLHSVEVGFEDIAMSLKVKKSKTDRWILDGSIRGKAKPGRMVRASF